MFFVLSKMLGLIYQPVNFIALALFLGVLLTVTRWARIGRAIVAVTAMVFVLACFSPFSTLLLRILEDRFPRPAADMAAPTGIIVLGGAMDEEVSRARGEISMSRAASRLTSSVALARRFPSARLIFTGGTADMRRISAPEADGVKRLWQSLGVPDAQVRYEDRSRNTFENAIFTRDMVAPKPGEVWLLVTSAWHMPRSMGIFRRAGFAVTAYPVDYRTFGDSRDWKPSVNALDSLDRLDTAFHEWAGLVAYWATAKTDALFPAP